MMRIDRLDHAAIRVRDLERTEAFYGDVLGFTVSQRFPEDAELIFAFGDGGHLLVQALGEDAVAPGPKGLGLHHLAFRVLEGEAGLDAARARLDERRIAYRCLDHGDHHSLYFLDPDGHTIEICHEPRGDRRPCLERARDWLRANARLVDRASFEVSFEGASPTRLLRALEAYRNDDGGFGGALEPDLRAATSQPLHTETALALLKEANVRSPEIATGCCAFLSRVAEDDARLPAFLADALESPAAPHWRAGFGATPTHARTFGMVALLSWHGARHPWLDFATERCIERLDTFADREAHHVLYASAFAAALDDAGRRRDALARLTRLLQGCEYFVPETPVSRYGLTPLHFAPRPDAPARAFFDDDLVDRHLADLERSQRPDGGWTIRFATVSAGAVVEWRGRFTVEALTTLRAYGRI